MAKNGNFVMANLALITYAIRHRSPLSHKQSGHIVSVSNLPSVTLFRTTNQITLFLESGTLHHHIHVRLWVLVHIHTAHPPTLALEVVDQSTA